MSEFNSAKFLTEVEDLHLNILLKREMSRDTLMLTLLRRYGMRPGELLSLRPCDLNPSGKSMLIKGLKGSRSRELPLSDVMWDWLYAESQKCPDPEMRVFNICLRRLQGIWEWWRPVKKPLRSLRHTFAVEMCIRTKDIHLVRNLLGHKNINNTLIYLDYVQSQDDFRKALVG